MARVANLFAALIFCAAAPGTADEKAEAPEKLVELRPDSKITLAFDKSEYPAEFSFAYYNGIRVPYRIADKLGLKGRGLGSFHNQDRSVRQDTMGGKNMVGIMGEKRLTNFYWPKLGNAADQRIVIGPEALGADVISMTLRGRQAGETVLAFKLVRFSKTFANWNSGVGTVARIGDRTALVYFAPDEKFSQATAMVGRLFAANFGGHYTGPARVDESHPEMHDADYRLRRMTTGLPLSLGTLAIDAVDIHDSTGKDGAIIPDGPRTEATDSAYEIVVEGLKREPPHVSYPVLHIGMDALGKCSNITFDFPKEYIYLSCVPGSGGDGIQLSPAGGFSLAK